MNDIQYIDRETGEMQREKVYGGFFIDLLYGQGFFSRGLGALLHLIAKCAIFSKIYGILQKRKGSRRKIEPFIQKYHIDAGEFLRPISSYQSFNDFFIRKLSPESRPIDPDPHVAILPADGRYTLFKNPSEIENISLKGSRFSLEELLGNSQLADRYRKGSILMARLCPVDYHRFHFPCDGIPDHPKLINGPLYSVNPKALKKNSSILSQNKRVLTTIATQHFGTILYLEIGATFVGSIQQTFEPGIPCFKGQEKGYFEFGGSCLLLLFEEGKITFEPDLLSSQGVEIRAKWGTPLGR